MKKKALFRKKKKEILKKTKKKRAQGCCPKPEDLSNIRWLAPPPPLCSRCSFSALLGWANTIKIPDHHKYQKKEFLHPTKWLEWVLKYSYLVSIVLNYQFPKTMLADLYVILIALDHTLIALAHTLKALTHLNSTDKLHRLLCE